MFKWIKQLFSRPQPLNTAAKSSEAEQLEQAFNVLNSLTVRLLSLEHYLRLQYQPPSVVPGAHVKMDIGPKKIDGCN